MSVYKALFYILVAAALSVPYIFGINYLKSIVNPLMMASIFFMGLSFSNISAWLSNRKNHGK